LALANRIGVAALMLLLVAAAHVHSAVLFAIFRLKIALVWVRAVALFSCGACSSMAFCNQGLQIALEWLRHGGCVLVCCCYFLFCRDGLRRAEVS